MLHLKVWRGNSSTEAYKTQYDGMSMLKFKEIFMTFMNKHFFLIVFWLVLISFFTNKATDTCSWSFQNSEMFLQMWLEFSVIYLISVEKKTGSQLEFKINLWSHHLTPCPYFAVTLLLYVFNVSGFSGCWTMFVSTKCLMF